MKMVRNLWLVLGAMLLVSGPSFAQEVSEEAERHMFRGQAAMQEAIDASGYRDAVAEFKQATQLAPDWADAWFNLGIAQEKTGDLTGAMSSFKRYLALNPKAVDGIEVKALIYKLEYLNDKATNEAKRKRDAAQRERDAAAKKRQNLSGEWKDEKSTYFSVKVNGNRIELTGDTHNRASGGEWTSKARLVGTISGHKIEGVSYSDTRWWPNGKIFERGGFSGTFSSDWSTLSIKYYAVYANGSLVSGKANGWRSVLISSKLKKVK